MGHKKGKITANAGDADFGLLLAAFLCDQRAIIEAQRRVILCTDDPEGVHQMRIAIRRVRSVLRAVGYKDIALQKHARQMAAQLGRVRDLEVLKLKYQSRTAVRCEAEYAEYLVGSWARQRQRLRVCLRDSRYGQFLQAYDCFAQSLQPLGLTNRRAAEKFIGAELRRTKKMGRKIDSNSPDRKLHRLRIECKRLRYIVELFVPVCGGNLKLFKRNARELQELLGAFNDEHVAMQALEHYAKRLDLTECNRGAFVEVGRQLDRHERNALLKRNEFESVWHKFDEKCTQKLLHQALT